MLQFLLVIFSLSEQVICKFIVSSRISTIQNRVYLNKWYVNNSFGLEMTSAKKSLSEQVICKCANIICSSPVSESVYLNKWYVNGSGKTHLLTAVRVYLNKWYVNGECMLYCTTLKGVYLNKWYVNEATLEEIKLVELSLSEQVICKFVRSSTSMLLYLSLSEQVICKWRWQTRFIRWFEKFIWTTDM